MKILHVSEKLRFSGAEILIKDLAIRHSALNDIAIASFAPTEENFLEIEKCLKNKNINLFIPKNNLSKIERFKFLIKVFKEFKPDIIVGHSAVINVYIRVVGLLFPNSKKVIILHAAAGDYEKEIKLRYLEYILQNFTDYVVGVSEWSASKYRKRFKKPPIITIHNGIELKKFQIKIKQEEREYIRNNLFKANNKEFVIIQVGRVSNVKNQLLTLMAINNLDDEIKKNIKIIFVGLIEEKDYFFKLQTFIKKNNLERNVIFLGSREDIPYLLKSSDLYVMPSKRENFSIAILEALASGIPIIYSDIIQFNFLDKYNFSNIWKFNLEDVIDYSKLIKNVYLNKLSFVQRNLNDFDIETTSNKYLTLFKRLLNE